MDVGLRYRFSYLAANSAASVDLWGYRDNEAVNFSGVVYAEFGDGVPFPLGRATLNMDEIYRDSNQDAAYRVHVRNLAPFNPCTIDVIEMAAQF